MPSPALVDATDLTVWANRRDAQEHLPHLVRRLILTTADGITRLQFRAGDGVLLPGWDGIAEVQTGNAFVPDGLSVWEMGTDRSVRSKAQDDYDKRSENPLGIDPAQAAFIFVTPRRWRDKEAWAAERTRDGRWREVRAYDADDLEAWLELSPAVHAWISELLGRSPEATKDLATYWATWIQATSPPLSADLVTAGRDEFAGQVLEQLAGPPGALALRADSRVEALAFLCASIHQLPDADREAVLARSLIVSDEAACDASPQPPSNRWFWCPSSRGPT